MRSAEVAPDAPQGKSRLMGRSADEALPIGDATGIGHGTAREPNPHAQFDCQSWHLKPFGKACYSSFRFSRDKVSKFFFFCPIQQFDIIIRHIHQQRFAQYINAHFNKIGFLCWVVGQQSNFFITLFQQIVSDV